MTILNVHQKEEELITEEEELITDDEVDDNEKSMINNMHKTQVQLLDDTDFGFQSEPIDAKETEIKV